MRHGGKHKLSIAAISHRDDRCAFIALFLGLGTLIFEKVSAPLAGGLTLVIAVARLPLEKLGGDFNFPLIGPPPPPPFFSFWFSFCCLPD